MKQVEYRNLTRQVKLQSAMQLLGDLASDGQGDDIDKSIAQATKSLQVANLKLIDRMEINER